MKEERLIGNSGIQEVRQQSLDLLAEIRDQAGILNDYFEINNNQEFLDVCTDADGKILEAHERDGTKHIYGKVKVDEKATFEDDVEVNGALKAKEATFEDDVKVNGALEVESIVTKDKDIFEVPAISIDGVVEKTVDDIEGRSEIKTDDEGKIISYRDSEGVKHENVGFNTPILRAGTFDYSEKNISDLMQILNDRNFGGSYDLRLPQVRVTSDLLTVNGNEIGGLNITKNEVECTYAFISTELNFVEAGTIAYQGNSTLADAKKGFSMVLTNKHRFKDWIEMDEFRLKGYGQDWTSGRDVVANRLYGQVLATRSYNRNKPWKKYNDFKSTDISLLMDADKKCHMDGFPVELYINNSYWGVYVLEIRKERANYNLNKKDNKHVQFEGEHLYADSRFTWDTIEIRNPKGYDEYVEPEEGPVKDFIVNWFNGISEITSETTQAELEEFLDCQNFIDWYLHNAVLNNSDVIDKNTEFTTWDGKHITLIPQDLNGAFHIYSNGDELAVKAYDKCSWLRTALDILEVPIKERYAELRNKGVFSIENLTHLWEDWCREVGTDAYSADQERWDRSRTPISSYLSWCVSRLSYLDTKFEYNNNNN